MTSIERASRKALPWAPFILGPILLFGFDLIRGQSLFWGAPMLQFTPWRTAAKEMVFAGNLPIWNPWLGMGAPLLANYQSALLYPPNWILLAMDVAWGQTLLVMLHLTWAGIGMALVARSLGLGPLSQSIAGLAYAMSGYLVARSGFLSINAAAAWLPWILYAAEQLAKEPRLRPAALLGLVLGLQWLAGHAQIAWYTLLFAVLWVAYRTWSHSNTFRRTFLMLALACALGFAIAAAQLLPTIEYAAVSNRARDIDREFALTYSFWPWRLTGLVAPDLFGNPRTEDFWGYGNFWEDAIYIGVLPFLLAAGALLSKRVGRMKWFLLGVAAVGLLLGLGRNTPVFVFLFENVPTFSLFQAPTRWNLWLVASLSLLAGFGAEHWRSAEGRNMYWLRLGTAGAGAVLLVSLLLGFLDTNIEPTFVSATSVAGFWLFASGILALLRSNQARLGWTAAVVSVVMIDLYFAGRGLNPTLPNELSSGISTLSNDVTNEHRVFMSSDLEREVKFDVAFQFESFQPDFDWRMVRNSGLPNTPILEQLTSANNFDPILPARYVEWMEQIERLSPSNRGSWLAYMDVGWEADGVPATYKPLQNPARAWIVPSAEVETTTTRAILRATSHDFDPSKNVVLEGDPPLQVGGLGTVVLFRDQGPGSIEVKVNAPDGGWLVVADTWYPGWDVTLDGQASKSYPANGVMRASWIPPGEHTVTYRYQPNLFPAGLILSALGLAAFAILRRA